MVSNPCRKCSHCKRAVFVVNSSLFITPGPSKRICNICRLFTSFYNSFNQLIFSFGYALKPPKGSPTALATTTGCPGWQVWRIAVGKPAFIWQLTPTLQLSHNPLCVRAGWSCARMEADRQSWWKTPTISPLLYPSFRCHSLRCPLPLTPVCLYANLAKTN